MSKNLTALASENLNPSLRGLLEDVQRGHIRVPRFQRPFVWTDRQRLELLRSIQTGIPIGSLLVWRTIQFNLPTFPTVGPHTIPPIVQTPPTTGWQYILDGHQRISTLFGLLIQSETETLPDQESEDDPVDWNIQYDLADDDFAFEKTTKHRDKKRPLLPLWTLLDGRKINKQMRNIRQWGTAEGWSDEAIDTWEVRADQLAYQFQQYRIPIVIVVTDELSHAADTFRRVNSLGTPMGEAHLVAALTWNQGFDLRERIDTLRNEFPPGWRDMEEHIFLQVCRGIAGLDITKAGQIELVKKLKNDKTLLDRAGTGLLNAVTLLSREAAVVRQELLPYAFQVILLAVEWDRWEENGHIPSKQSVMAWFWRTSWSQVFSTASFRQVRTEQKNLRHCADQAPPQEMWTRSDNFPKQFNFRSALVRLFVLRFAMRPGLGNVKRSPVEGRTLLKNHGRSAWVRMFSAPPNASPTLKKLLQGAGNRFLINPNTDSVFRTKLQRGTLSKTVREFHFAGEEACQAVREGNLETFLRQRTEAMETWEHAEWHKEKESIITGMSLLS